MKKLILKIVSYLFIISFITYSGIYILILFFPHRVLGNVNGYFLWEYQMTQLNNKNNKDKNIILGDSRGMALLNPSIIGKSYTNFSIGGTTTVEGYYSLMKVLGNRKIDTLILCYGPIHFFGQNREFEDRTLPFKFINEIELKQIERIESRYNQTIDNKIPSLLLNIKRSLLLSRFPPMYRATLLSNFSKKGFDLINSEIKIHKGQCLFGNLDSSNGKSQEATDFNLNSIFKVNPVFISYLDSIYKKSTENNITLYFVSPPLNKETFFCIKNTLLYNSYLNIMNTYKTKYPKMKFIDEIKYLPNRFFGDPSHVNREGSNFYSKYLTAKIKP